MHQITVFTALGAHPCVIKGAYTVGAVDWARKPYGMGLRADVCRIQQMSPQAVLCKRVDSLSVAAALTIARSVNQEGSTMTDDKPVSRKQQVKAVYEAQGADAARNRAQELGLAESTTRGLLNDCAR